MRANQSTLRPHLFVDDHRVESLGFDLVEHLRAAVHRPCKAKFFPRLLTVYPDLPAALVADHLHPQPPLRNLKAEEMISHALPVFSLPVTARTETMSSPTWATPFFSDKRALPRRYPNRRCRASRVDGAVAWRLCAQRAGWACAARAARSLRCATRCQPVSVLTALGWVAPPSEANLS